MNELPEIDFEGTAVIPKRGVYRCPYNCSDPRYPEKKWKTERGFRNHMKSCPKCPSAVDKRQKIETARLEVFEAKKELALLQESVNIGDTIWFVYDRIVKPTHEWRGNREVRVRYEAVHSYSPRREGVKTIDYDNNGIVFNGYIRKSWLAASENVANGRAECLTRQHAESLEFASRCR